VTRGDHHVPSLTFEYPRRQGPDAPTIGSGQQLAAPGVPRQMGSDDVGQTRARGRQVTPPSVVS